ncbi:MAG: hypothetical protein WBA05_16490 [Gordonia sp. (in: high G+C Gram-positive bacteria)]|uniref:hypothetical protein n=1 Tax=Gordonia TaxID=2053 RepID=UPI003264BF5A
MRRIHLAAAGVAIAATAALTPAGIASAAPSANTDVTFVIAGLDGDLSITAGPLGTIVPAITGQSATGTLPTVTVTDSRNGSPRNWTTTASSTPFTSTDQTIPNGNVDYTATAIAGKVGGGSVAATGTQSLSAAKNVVTRTGLNMPTELITWTPSLTVNYPGGAAIGTYSGTITVSVA